MMESATGHHGRIDPGSKGPTSTPLKIAMVIPPWYEIPPAGYGGLEAVCASLIDGLVARGHDVTLFGAGTRTGTAARFVSTNPELQYRRLLEAMPELVHITRVNELLAEGRFDIVHDHSTIGPLTAIGRDVPTVVTVHGCPVGEVREYLSRLDGSVGLISISRAQRRVAPELNWVTTIHHGIEIDGPAKSEPTDGPVLWLGRFDREKGPDIAVTACQQAGLPLVLAGKANQKDEWRYLEEVIKPMLASASDVELVLNGHREQTNSLLHAASVLLLPIRWEEPFGMVMIEAMARGTPVVALRRGSVPEVIAHGRTGYICASEAQLPEALHQAAVLNPADCVTHVKESFSVELMARRHERFYRRFIMERRRAGSRGLHRGRAGVPLIAGVPSTALAAEKAAAAKAAAEKAAAAKAAAEKAAEAAAAAGIPVTVTGAVRAAAAGTAARGAPAGSRRPG